MEDPRELLEEHEREALEARLHEAVIDAACRMLDPSNDVVERDFYRWDLFELRQQLKRVQRQNGTQLVIASRTYDSDGGDECAELTDADACRLAWDGIAIPDNLMAAAMLNDGTGSDSDLL